MTGFGRGFCVLKLPPHSGMPVTGLAGRSGWPVGRLLEREAELTQLRNRVRHIEAALTGIRGQIERLQAARTQEPVGTQEELESP